MSHKQTLLLGGLLGMLGVIAGAFGGHMLGERLSAKALGWWTTATHYQQIHAVALIALGFAGGSWTRWRRWAGLLFVVGILLFSGTLYTMALGGPRWLGAVTPLGGVTLICAWGCVVVHAAGRR